MLEFVFVFPLIFALVRHSKWGLIQCFFINAAYDCLGKVLWMSDALYRLLVFRYTFVIAFGCSLALGTGHIKKQVKAVCWFIGTIYIFLVCYTDWHSYIDYGWGGTNFIGALYVLPIFEFLYCNRGKMHCKVLEQIGKASFDIYLTQKIYTFYDDAIWQLLIGKMPNPFIQILVALPVCTGTGILFYHVETRVFRWAMSVLDKVCARFSLKAFERLLFEQEQTEVI